MYPEVSWGSLDQDNTSCLFWGIPDLEDQDVVPLEPIEVVTLCNAFVCRFGLQCIFDGCDGNSCVFLLLSV